jgi:Uncharacterized protein conserved in bacteria
VHLIKNATATTEVAPTTTTTTNTTDANQQKLDDNKKLVSDFLQAFFGDKDTTAIDKYLADNIIQHSPLLHDTKEGLKKIPGHIIADPTFLKQKLI